jgi:hypothetical protein
MATVSPSCTVWPSATAIDFTTPARGACGEGVPDLARHLEHDPGDVRLDVLRH